MALGIEQIQLGDAVDVVAIHQVLPAWIVDIHHHDIQPVGLSLLKLQHCRCHFTAHLAPIGIELDDGWPAIAEGHLRFKGPPGELIQGRTALQTTASQGESNRQRYCSDTSTVR